MGEAVAVEIEAIEGLALRFTIGLSCAEGMGGGERVRGGTALGGKCHWMWLSRTCVGAVVQVAGAVFNPHPLAVFAPV